MPSPATFLAAYPTLATGSRLRSMALSINHDPPSFEHKTLPLEIRAATRSCHTILNHSVTSRLPLCLPPHAATPAVYVAGIACFARIYFLFEDVWENILTRGPENSRVQHVLKQLKLPSLFRSAKLKADLSLLTQRLGGQVELYKGADGELTALLGRMREAIRDKPHLIMSYTWVMYLALFNGGRWIRAQLEQAGPGFWGTQAHPQSSKIDCLSFWEFEGEHDGEDIKNDLKARFNVAATVLEDPERQDVVDECVRAFETCSQMVAWLDKQAQPISA